MINEIKKALYSSLEKNFGLSVFAFKALRLAIKKDIMYKKIGIAAKINNKRNLVILLYLI